MASKMLLTHQLARDGSFKPNKYFEYFEDNIPQPDAEIEYYGYFLTLLLFNSYQAQSSIDEDDSNINHRR